MGNSLFDPKACSSHFSASSKAVRTQNAKFESPVPCNRGSRYRQAEAGLTHTPEELCFPAPVQRSESQSEYGTDASHTAEMTLARYAQTVGDEKREAGEKVASLVLMKKEDELSGPRLDHAAYFALTEPKFYL